MVFKFPPERWEVLVDPERKKWQDVDVFFDVAEPKECDVWIDLGCGPGYFTLPLSKNVKRVYAVDIEDEMLKKCKLRAEMESLRNIEYVKCSEEEIPIENEMADAVLMANVFHELINPEAVFSEVRRILKDKGRVYIIDWYPVESPAGPPLEERVPLEEVVNFLEYNGFLSIREYNVYPYHYLVEFRK